MYVYLQIRVIFNLWPSLYSFTKSESHHQSFLQTQGMKTSLILVLLLVSLSQALPVKLKIDSDDADDDFIEASEIGNFHMLPFLRAVMSSEELQWEVMRNWLMDKGILKLKKPKKKLRRIRLFWFIKTKTNWIIDHWNAHRRLEIKYLINSRCLNPKWFSQFLKKVHSSFWSKIKKKMASEFVWRSF